MLQKITAFFIILCVFWGCKKDFSPTNNPNVRLEFSTDTLLFDTVFTSIGSTTRRVKIYNKSKEIIQISEIKLLKPNTNYRFNIDGIQGPLAKDITIAPEDSAFVFVEVTIDPNADQLPFIVEDLLQFTTNGNTQQLPLAAYGQNAHFLNDSILPNTTTWVNDLPYVIFNGVKVDAGKRLTIKEGCRIHFHKNAILLVNGTLRIDGTLADSVVLQGDRLEQIYRDEPGQWGGIFIQRGSVNNRINHAIIRNAIRGIQVDSLPESGQYNLQLYNTTLSGHQQMGVLGISASIQSYNNLFYNCGQYAFAGIYGGTYDIAHCTIGNYNYFFDRKTPSVLFTDYLKISETQILELPCTTSVLNTIIWGSIPDEFLADFRLTSQSSVLFDYNLVRSKSNFTGNNIVNKDPMFINSLSEDYHLDSFSSPASKKGIYLENSPILLKDKDERTRNNPPTIGSFETF